MMAMRPSRTRTAAVFLLAVFYAGAGVASALAVCCETDMRASSGPMMKCHEMGGPNHMCPFMPNGARQAPSNGGTLGAGCASGLDQGVPVTGIGGLPDESMPLRLPTMTVVTLDQFAERAIVRDSHPPTPPPKHLL